jgi:hypothetical protein
MSPRSLFLLLLLGMAPVEARAVAVLEDGTTSYNLTAPTAADIPNWDTGWGISGTTGWNYVGSINGGDSAVYLGNNWVLTAGHVGPGTFVLGGVGYSMVPGSAQSFTTTSGTTVATADLTMFELTTAPDLPALAISATPTPLSSSHSGSLLAMIGNGPGLGESWGLDTVTGINVPIEISGHNYLSKDIETAFGPVTAGTNSITNNAWLVGGDSGGGDFIYNASTGAWTLAGINEAVDTSSSNSYMVQLSAYASQINHIAAVPEPSGFLLAGLALAALPGLRRLVRKIGRFFG